MSKIVDWYANALDIFFDRHDNFWSNLVLISNELWHMISYQYLINMIYDWRIFFVFSVFLLFWKNAVILNVSCYCLIVNLILLERWHVLDDLTVKYSSHFLTSEVEKKSWSCTWTRVVYLIVSIGELFQVL